MIGKATTPTADERSKHDAHSTPSLMVLDDATGYMINLHGDAATHALLCETGASGTVHFPATPQMIKYKTAATSDSGTHFYASGLAYSVEIHNESTQTIYVCYGTTACSVNTGREIMSHSTAGFGDVQIQNIHIYNGGSLGATATVTFWKL